MNINTLRKHYDRMSIRERLALADAAMNRDDENEMSAIIASSPSRDVSCPDFADALHWIKDIRLISTITRLGELIRFVSIVGPNHQGDIPRAARFSAYQYMVAVDSLAGLNAELRLGPHFERELAKCLPLEALQASEDAMRNAAFSAEEAREYAEASGQDMNKFFTAEELLQLHLLRIQDSFPSGFNGGRLTIGRGGKRHYGS